MIITDNNIALVSVAVAETIKQLKESKKIDSLYEIRPRELLSIQEIIDLYPNLSEKSIREAVTSQGLKYIKMGKGGKFLIDRQDLEDFIEKSKTSGTSLYDVSSNYKHINMKAILDKQAI